GMVLARKPPVGGLDLGVAGAGFDPQHRVVILELHACSVRAATGDTPGRGRVARSGRKAGKASPPDHGVAPCRRGRANPSPPTAHTEPPCPSSPATPFPKSRSST